MTKENIVLVGFMGCGKTSVGRNLSYMVDRKFVDSDAEIENEAGMSIPDMFLNEGEGYFRIKERQMIAKIATYKKSVIATGGGVVLDQQNVEALSETGVIIYLKADIEHIYNNLKLDTSRPLLKTENPYETMKNLLSNRTVIYEQTADIIVDVTNKSIVEIVDEIKKIVEG